MTLRNDAMITTLTKHTRRRQRRRRSSSHTMTMIDDHTLELPLHAAGAEERRDGGVRAEPRYENARRDASAVRSARGFLKRAFQRDSAALLYGGSMSDYFSVAVTPVARAKICRRCCLRARCCHKALFSIAERSSGGA